MIIFHQQHLQSQIKNNTVSLKPKAPLAEAPKVHIADITLSTPPAYKVGELIATRLAYGTALKKIADTNLRSVSDISSILKTFLFINLYITSEC